MNGRTFVTHLAVAALAFALGWTVSQGGSESSGSRVDLDGEPTAVFARILRMEDPGERAVALVAFFDSADPSLAIMLRDVLKETESDLVIDEISETLFASWWAKSDPAAAFANIVDPAWTNRHPWVRTVVREWVWVDPVAAVAGVQSLPENPSQGRLEGARVVLDEWFLREDFADPTPLLGMVRPFEPKARARAVEHMLSSMIEARGVDAAEQFVESIPDDSGAIGVSVQQEFMARMGVALIDHDVDRAKAWAIKHGQGRKGVGVLKHIAYYWAVRDGSAAMEWAMELPESPERGGVVKRAWISFGHADPDGAREWLHARVPDGQLMGIYARHLRFLAQEDPETALALANKAPDPAVRERMLVSVGKGWMRSDPEAVDAWLATTELSAELQQQIRAAAGNPVRPGGPIRPGSSGTGPS